MPTQMRAGGPPTPVLRLLPRVFIMSTSVAAAAGRTLSEPAADVVDATHHTPSGRIRHTP